MIRQLQRRVLSLLLHSPSHLAPSRNPPPFSPRRLLSAISPKPFAAMDYLVTTCGLTRAQALKAYKKVSHLKSPSKPDAVIAFLSGLGLTRSDIAAFVAADPQFLCASVEKTLAPGVAELRGLGLSRTQIAGLLPHSPCAFRSSSLGRNTAFWLSAFGGSFEALLMAVRRNSGLLGAQLEKVSKPNLAFLRETCIDVLEVTRTNLYSSYLFTMNPKSLREAADRVEELGVKPGSRSFRRALTVFAFMSKEDLATKIELLNEIGFSQEDLFMIARKAPHVLGMSEGKIQGVMDFLLRDIGMEASYIAQRPALMMYSLERRLLPRHWVLKVLREKGLQNVEFKYYIASVAERDFVRKFVHPYKDLVPGLADNYASRCSGKPPSGAAWQEV
ncbi:hypothetical protein ACP70R_041570 [Stipagrostis hirtigluma subsp. patula]